MSHMCDLLCDEYSDEFRVFKIYPKPTKLYSKIVILNKIIRFVLRKYHTIKHNINYHIFLGKIKPGDEIYLLEYLLPECDQLFLAKKLKSMVVDLKIYGLAHLTPSALLTVLTKTEIEEWTNQIDYILTLGSSLSLFLEKCKIYREKIKTGFHYVDNVYYKPFQRINANKKMRVITIGNLQRNFILLEKIVQRLQNIDFVVFSGGNKAVESVFCRYSNVMIKGYINECELRFEMNQADISLNVMEDTVGSNVITTSLAMGLAMVVSDVGSIRDYCNEDCAFFCNNEDEYVDAIKALTSNSTLLQNKRKEAFEISKRLSIGEFYNFLKSI